MTSFPKADTTEYGQALYLTCTDWPNTPGATCSGAADELFTVRNIGNLVPTDPADASIDAALHFAVTELAVRSIVVCGHSGCAAMKTLLSESIDSPVTPVSRWLDYGRDALHAYQDFHLARVSAAASGLDQTDQLAIVNVAIQVERLVHHPILVAAVVSGRLRVAGTFFSAAAGRLYEVTATGIPTPGIA